LAKLKERFLHFRYKGIICIVLVFSLIAAILFVERSGIQVNYQKVSLDAVPEDTVITKATAFKKSPKNTLLLFNSAKENSMQAYEQFQVIFEDMKVGYDAVDVSVKMTITLMITRQSFLLFRTLPRWEKKYWN